MVRAKGIMGTGISLLSHLTSCEPPTRRRMFVNSYGGVTVKRRLRRLKYTVAVYSPGTSHRASVCVSAVHIYFTLLNITQAKIPRLHLEVTKKYLRIKAN